MMYEAFVNQNAAKAVNAVERLEFLFKSSVETDILYELTHAQQAILDFEIKEDYYELLYEKAKVNSEKLLNTENYKSYGHTFLASIYATQMGKSAMSAMFLAPKNKSHLKMAIEADGSNPVAWLQFGGYKFFAPGFFGGDLDDAINAFETSIGYFEAHPDQLELNWDYLGALYLLTRSYEKSGRQVEASVVKEKARSIEPRLAWVNK